MNSFGRIFRMSLFGESHGKAIGVVLDGVPPGIPLAEDDFTADLDRRRSGATGTTPRREPDRPQILSGVLNGYTTGAPAAILFENTDSRSSDYDALKDIPRPGHTDFAAWKKSGGFADLRGGGHSSGRVTLALVAAGVVAKKILQGIEISTEILEIGGEKDYRAKLEQAIAEGDSLGGIIQCMAKGIPAGWGEPFFDSIESVISHMVFSIPAVKAIEFGAGFRSAGMSGSQHNDPIIDCNGATATNHAGGINGGISNGNELVLRVAVKPTSSIAREQKSLNLRSGEMETFRIEGRHDACIALRIPVVVEAAVAVALADLSRLCN